MINNSPIKEGESIRGSKKINIKTFQLFESIGTLGLFLIIFIITSILEPTFISNFNIINLLINTSIMAISGFGMTFVIAGGGFDLSIGSMQALIACMIATLLNVLPIPIVIFIGLLIGLFIGIINGLLITKLKVPILITTLAMSNILAGAALLYTDGASIFIKNNNFAVLTTGKFLGLPVPFIIAIVALLISYIIFKHTPFGRHVCAVGGNKAAAIAVGINADKVIIVVFGLAGLMAALAGVLLASKLMVVDATLGKDLPLQVITLVILGGSSLSGGKGSMPGTLIGALLIATVSSSLNVMRVSPFYQYLALGIMLIMALALDTIRRNLLDRIGRV